MSEKNNKKNLRKNKKTRKNDKNSITNIVSEIKLGPSLDEEIEVYLKQKENLEEKYKELSYEISSRLKNWFKKFASDYFEIEKFEIIKYDDTGYFDILVGNVPNDGTRLPNMLQIECYSNAIEKLKMPIEAEYLYGTISIVNQNLIYRGTYRRIISLFKMYNLTLEKVIENSKMTNEDRDMLIELHEYEQHKNRKYKIVKFKSDN